MGNWERLVWNQRHLLFDGLVVTVEICLIAFAAAIVGGLVLCLVRLYVRPLRLVANALIEFFRATPIFVQLLWVNYVWPELFGWPDSFFTAGWVALALQSSGYLAETFRAGIEAVPRGQIEAGRALGLRPWPIFRCIIIMPALQTVFPALASQFILVVLGSSVISTISAEELTAVANNLQSQSFRPFEVYFVVGGIYLAMSLGFQAG